MLHDEVSRDAGGRPGPSHDAVDDYDTAGVDSARDELGGPVEVAGDVGDGKIIDMEAVIVDAVAAELGGVDSDVALGCVEDVCDADALEVVDVLDGFAIGEYDAFVNFVTVDANVPSLVEIGCGFKSWHHPVLPSPCMHN